MICGNGGQDIFSDEADWVSFYDLLEEGVKRSIVCAREEQNRRLAEVSGGVREDSAQIQICQA